MEKNRPICRCEFPISKKGGVGFGDPTPFFTTSCTRGKPNAAVPDYSVIALRQIAKKYIAAIAIVIAGGVSVRIFRQTALPITPAGRFSSFASPNGYASP